MSTKSVKSFVAAFILAVVAIAAYWYWSPFIAIKQMQSAAEAKDADAFNERVDYPKLRESFKGQFSAMMVKQMGSSGSAGSGFEALGSMLGMALVNQMIDTMVRPETVMRAMQEGQFSQIDKTPAGNSGAIGGAPQKQNNTDWFFERKSADVLIGYAADPAKPDAKREERLGLVFVRNGFADWKLSEVRMPLTE